MFVKWAICYAKFWILIVCYLNVVKVVIPSEPFPPAPLLPSPLLSSGANDEKNHQYRDILSRDLSTTKAMAIV